MKSSNSTELVPRWKVYGFSQMSGSIVKDAKDLTKRQMISLSVQIPSHLMFAASNDDSKKISQESWYHRLMHRSRSCSH